MEPDPAEIFPEFSKSFFRFSRSLNITTDTASKLL
jgi:hypothetical protein